MINLTLVVSYVNSVACAGMFPTALARGSCARRRRLVEAFKRFLSPPPPPPPPPFPPPPPPHYPHPHTPTPSHPTTTTTYIQTRIEAGQTLAMQGGFASHPRRPSPSTKRPIGHSSRSTPRVAKKTAVARGYRPKRHVN